jgi:hypothetical protein
MENRSKTLGSQVLMAFTRDAEPLWARIRTTDYGLNRGIVLFKTVLLVFFWGAKER